VVSAEGYTRSLAGIHKLLGMGAWAGQMALRPLQSGAVARSGPAPCPYGGRSCYHAAKTRTVRYSISWDHQFQATVWIAKDPERAAGWRPMLRDHSVLRSHSRCAVPSTPNRHSSAPVSGFTRFLEAPKSQYCNRSPVNSVGRWSQDSPTRPDRCKRVEGVAASPTRPEQSRWLYKGCSE